MENNVKRFWKRVKKTNNCWIWQGHLKNKYGGIFFDGKEQTTHRFSWILHFGDIPEKMDVCHKCDNKRCVRPDHLFLGTRSENNIDMMLKGRSKNAKLTIEDVKEIRKLYAKGLKNYTEIGRRYGVADYAISSIIKKRQWWYA